MIGTGTALAIAGGGALLGGIGGAIPQKSSSSSGITTAPVTHLEGISYNNLLKTYPELIELFGKGPGAQDVADSLVTQQGLAAAYDRASARGGLPDQNDIGAANRFAHDMFAARRLGLQQSMQDQMTSYNRQLAASGRDINDPIARARFYEQQQRAESMLGAEQQGYASQLALALPQQRLGYQAQAAQVRDALATQALQNRANLLGLGSNLMNAERAFRVETGTRWGEQKSGGGFGGALTGLIGGATAGINIAGGLNSMGAMNKWAATLPSTPSPMPQARAQTFNLGGFGGQTWGGVDPTLMSNGSPLMGPPRPW